MYTNSKNKKYTLFGLILLCLVLCSCDISFDKDVSKVVNSSSNIGIKGNEIVILAEDDSAFTLKTSIEYGKSYVWYSCDKDKGNAKKVADTKVFNGTWTSAMGPIEYFYCEVDGKQSKVFTVAKTGLAKIEVITKNLASLENKDQELMANVKISKASKGLISKNFEFTDYATEFSGHGNSTWNTAKHSYNLKLEKKKDLMTYSISTDSPVEREDGTASKKWCLISNAFDRSLLRNYTASKLATALVSDASGKIIGDWTPQMEFADVFVNGTYMGNYLLTEKNRLDKKSRMAIKDISEEIKEGKEEKYGFILEVDGRADAAYYFTSPLSGFTFTMCDPDFEGPEDAKQAEDYKKAMEWIKSYINEIETYIYEKNWEKIQEKVAVTSLANYFIVCELTKNRDSAVFSSIYMYRDTNDQKLHYGPIWDFDLSSGNDSKENLTKTDGWHYKNAGWFGQLFQIPEFVNLVKDTWNSKREAIKQVIDKDLTDAYKRISVSANLNFERWDTFGSLDQPYSVGMEDRNSFESEYRYLHDWLNDRYIYLDTQINKW